MAEHQIIIDIIQRFRQEGLERTGAEAKRIAADLQAGMRASIPEGANKNQAAAALRDYRAQSELAIRNSGLTGGQQAQARAAVQAAQDKFVRQNADLFGNVKLPSVASVTRAVDKLYDNIGNAITQAGRGAPRQTLQNLNATAGGAASHIASGTLASAGIPGASRKASAESVLEGLTQLYKAPKVDNAKTGVAENEYVRTLADITAVTAAIKAERAAMLEIDELYMASTLGLAQTNDSIRAARTAQRRAGDTTAGDERSYQQRMLTSEQRTRVDRRILASQQGELQAIADSINAREDLSAATKRLAIATLREQGLLGTSRYQNVVAGLRSTPDRPADPRRETGALAGTALRGINLAQYAVSGAVFYGAITALHDLTEQALVLDRTFSTIRAQFEAVGDGDEFNGFRAQMLSISRETGLTATEVANVGFQMKGAFGGTAEAIEQTRQAMQATVVTGIPQAELTDSLTGIAKTYGVNISQITDLTVGLEERTGVLARQTMAVLGDIAPVAKEAGGSLQEIGGIAAAIQQQSGRSGTAIAESLGRILPGMSEISGELLISYDRLRKTGQVSDESFGNFQRAITSGDNVGALLELTGQVEHLDDTTRSYFANLIGQRREAQTVNALFQNQAVAIREAGRSLEENAGKGAERFERVQRTLQTTLARLRQSFAQLGDAMARAGLLDAFKDIASVALLLMQALTGLISAFGDFNQALGGVPGRIAAIVVAYRGLSLLFRGLGGGGGTLGRAGAALGFAGATGGVGAGLAQTLGLVAGVAGLRGLASRGAQYRVDQVAAATANRDRMALYGATEGMAARRAATGTYAANALLGASLLPGAALGRVGGAFLGAGRGAGLVGRLGIGAGLAGGLAIGGITAGALTAYYANNQRINARDEYDKIRDDARRFQEGSSDEVLRRQFEQGPTRSGTGFRDRLGFFLTRRDPNEIENLNREVYKSRTQKELELAQSQGLFANRAAGHIQNFQGRDTFVPDFDNPLGKFQQNIRDIQGRIAKGGPDADAAVKEARALLDSLTTEQQAALEEAARNHKDIADLIGEDEKKRDLALAQLTSDVDAAGAAYEAGEISAPQYQAALDAANETLQDAVRSRGGDVPPNLLEAARRAKKAASDFAFQDAQQQLNIVQELAAIGGASPQQMAAAYNNAAAQIYASDKLTPQQKAEIASGDIANFQAAFQDSIANARSSSEAAAIASRGQKIPQNVKDAYFEAYKVIVPDIAADAAVWRNIRQQALQEQIGAINLKASLSRDPATINRAAQDAARVQATQGYTLADRQQGAISLNQARLAAEDIAIDNARAELELLAAQHPDNAVEQARIQQRQAADAVRNARGRGRAAEARALAQQIAADRTMEKAMDELMDSRIDLLMAQAEAAGDTVASAQYQLQKSQDALSDLTRLDPTNETGINQARGQVTLDEANVRSTTLNLERELAQFDYDMGRITRQQLVAKLEALKVLARPDELRDIERTIRQLKQEASADFQFNLPGDLTLPTLYDARRLNQAGFGSLGGVGEFGAGGVANNDNRTITITLNATNAVDGQAAVETIVEALNAAPRTGTQPRIY